jgi:hypothetical protein
MSSDIRPSTTRGQDQLVLNGQGKAVTCDHRRWGIRDCRKARHCCGQCVLQFGSGRTIPVVREALTELTLGQRALNIWVFIGDVREEFILGLDIPRAYHATVDVGRHGLRPARLRCQ